MIKKYLAKRKFKKAKKAGKMQGPLPAKKKPLRSLAKKAKSKISGMTSKGRAKKIGAAKGTKVSKGAVGVVKTKGGDFVKYKKDSKAAGSFRSTFKKECKGKSAGSTFEWQGRKYSCAKK
tara:strand:- start:60 stop:419 length:360 start_codon:yes stop_codon:yes gene_type:complete